MKECTRITELDSWQRRQWRQRGSTEMAHGRRAEFLAGPRGSNGLTSERLKRRTVPD